MSDGALCPGEIGYLEFVGHISEDDLERYAMRILPEAELKRVEEHLLICAECRQRLEKTEGYVAAIGAPPNRQGFAGSPARARRDYRYGRIARPLKPRHENFSPVTNRLTFLYSTIDVL